MEFKTADEKDFDKAFYFIENLWSYNTYDKTLIHKIYNEVINNKDCFAFFITDKGDYKGFCHGDIFNTFWMSGKTCYVSSLITKENERGKGYGQAMLDHVKELAKHRDCKALILDSGLSRTSAHKFYENYGFEKSCYGFEFSL